MSEKDKKTPNYAFPVAANPGTVRFLTLPMEERRKLGYAPSFITDADRVAAAKILDKTPTPTNVARMKLIV